MRIDLRERYFQWMLMKIGATTGSYNHILRHLFNTEFHVVLEDDTNRYNDGIDFRYQFAYENNIPYDYIPENIPEPCSILEMMVALAFRVENETMSNSVYGDRTYIWFWDMFETLGLMKYDDAHYNRGLTKINAILNAFVTRSYNPDGTGGLVTLANPLGDMRPVDIWTQMTWKINEYIERYGG